MMMRQPYKSIGHAALFAIAILSGAVAEAETFKYDVLGRLTSVTYANGVTTNYAYDGAGNRVTSGPNPSSSTDTGPWANGASLQFCQGQFATVRATYTFTISGAPESAVISNLGSTSTFTVVPSGWTNGATLAAGTYSFQITVPNPGSWPISMTFGNTSHVLSATIVGVTKTTCP